MNIQSHAQPHIHHPSKYIRYKGQFSGKDRVRTYNSVKVHKNHIKQGVRFVVVGLVNTAIDFIVLNALIFIFGLSGQGLLFLTFKVIAFLAAATNSFILNKHWVFEEHTLTRGRKFYAQIYKFISVSAFSLIVNGIVSYAVFRIGHSSNPDISTQLLANISALAGVCAVFCSNFFGYKLFVFKK